MTDASFSTPAPATRLDNYLREVRSTCLSAVSEPRTTLGTTTTPFVERGGKGIRAQMVLAAAVAASPEIVSATTDQLIAHAGAAVELLHLSTLIHDDILDESSMRRGLPTINTSSGDHVALLAGDLLIARAWRSALEAGPVVGASLAEALDTITIGQAEELLDRSSSAPRSLVRYLECVERKTAALFAASATIGARTRDAPPVVEAIAGHVGRDFGVAFQLIDDLHDAKELNHFQGKPSRDRDLGILTISDLESTHETVRRVEELLCSLEENLVQLPGDSALLRHVVTGGLRSPLDRLIATMEHR